MKKEIYSKPYRTLYLLLIDISGKCPAQLIVDCPSVSTNMLGKLDCDYNLILTRFHYKNIGDIYIVNSQPI